MKKKNNVKRWIGMIKYPVTILILILILRKIDIDSLSVIITQLPVNSLIILFILSLVKIYLQYNNWKTFLNLITESKIKESTMLLSFFAGISFRMVSPGGVGVYGRMFLLPAAKRQSFWVITYEKFIQTWCIIILGAVGGALYFEDLPFIWKILVIGIILILPILLPHLISRENKYRKYAGRYINTLVPVTFWQIVINFITIIQYYLFFSNYIEFSLRKAISSVPLVQISNLIPVTISGLGLREYFAIRVYEPLGISGELAISCSLSIFVLSNLLPAMVGVILLLISNIQKRNGRRSEYNLDKKTNKKIVN